MRLAEGTIKCADAETDCPPLLKLRDVEKRFANGNLALSGINLSFERGSFVSLLGASGCGKSTILKLIAGLSRPSRGSITWCSGPLGDRATRNPKVGFIFQEATLMPWTCALNNVAMPLILSGSKKQEARRKAREALDSMALGKFEHSYPRELSGGMKMRVSIARALVTEPEILLLDEPFAALDEITRSRINNDLAELWRKRRFTAIFVTHSVYESVYLSQRVIILASRPGRVFADLVVPEPSARDETFRLSVEYTEHCRQMSEALKGAMNL
jgi:NitT/TauT family transport system ATP-binding protein